MSPCTSQREKRSPWHCLLPVSMDVVKKIQCNISRLDSDLHHLINAIVGVMKNSVDVQHVGKISNSVPISNIALDITAKNVSLAPPTVVTVVKLMVASNAALNIVLNVEILSAKIAVMMDIIPVVTLVPVERGIVVAIIGLDVAAPKEKIPTIE